MRDPKAAPVRGSVDVVIPTFNNLELALRCIAALDDAAVARIVAVDDVSDAGICTELQRKAPHVEVVALEEHRGLAHAMNAGAARGTAPYVLFLNDDVLSAPQSVDSLARHLDSRPALCFVGGRLVDPETLATQRQYAPRAVPGCAALLARVAGVERLWRANPLTGQHLRDPLPEDVDSTIVRQPAGACLMVRRTALEQVGGWDERFWFWYEDVDLVARLLRVGRGAWEPRARFVHVGRHSTRSWDKPKQHARLYHSTLRYAERHCSRAGALAVAAGLLLACLLRVPPYALRGREEAVHVYTDLARQAVAVACGRDPGPPSPRVHPPRARRALVETHGLS